MFVCVRVTDGECAFVTVRCCYLSTVSQHGVWWFGQLLPANDLENELLLGVSWKWVIAERVERAWREKEKSGGATLINVISQS